jgi:hypothetical protein
MSQTYFKFCIALLFVPRLGTGLNPHVGDV